MTDPIDDTQPHRSGDPSPTSDEAAPAADPAGPVADPAAPDTAEAAPGPGAPGSQDSSTTGPPLRADPDRPADSGWREPPWFPPRERDRRPSAFALVVGLVLIAIGAYYFIDRTLGIALPPIQWSGVWPIILIVIGGLILVRSFQRKS